MVIYSNTILQQVATGDRIRIIWMDEIHGVAIAISMKSDSAMPYFVEMEELRIMLEEGMMEQVEDTKRKIDKLTENEKNVRDEKWNLIRSFLDSRKHDDEFSSPITKSP